MELVLQVNDSEASREQLDDLTVQLREQLLDLDVDDVAPVGDGQAPAGARGLEVAAVGALLVTLGESRDVLREVITAVRGWLERARQPARAVTMTVGDRTLELTGASSEQVDRLIEEFVLAGRTKRSRGG